MKKLFTAALGTLMVFGLVACGGSKDPTKDPSVDPTPSGTPSVDPSDPFDHVFACEEGSAIHYQGGAFGWDLADENKMEAASINDVADIDEEVATILAGQIDNIKYLYIAEGLEFGAEDAGWTTNVKRNGEVVAVNGSHTIKARRGHYDAEDEAYVSDQWIPDPHTSHAMSLTPDTLFIAENWAEEADEDGFDWTANPAAFDAGVYTFIAVEFKATASPETYSAGLALVPIANA